MIGDAYNALNLNGQPPSFYQPASSAITDFNIQNQNVKSSEISETVAGGYDADGNFNKIMTFNWSGHSSDSDQPPSYI